MQKQNIIEKEDEICLLEDDERVFLIDKNGIYMTAERMLELSEKMIETAKKYGGAITEYNSRRV